MAIACLIFMAVMLGVGAPLLYFELAKKKRFPWIGLICVILIGAMFTVGISGFEHHVINNAEYQVDLCGVPINTHKEVYYDAAEECYFVIKMHDWDIAKTFYRYELNYEEVKAYVEHAKAIDAIDLFD